MKLISLLAMKQSYILIKSDSRTQCVLDRIYEIVTNKSPYLVLQKISLLRGKKRDWERIMVTHIEYERKRRRSESLEESKRVRIERTKLKTVRY
jgi:hypothetical protein